MDNLKLVLKSEKKKSTTFQVGNVNVGEDFLIIAGPCSVESEDQVMVVAKEVKKLGANMLRGGAYKPRTSPYSFQGLGREGLKLLYKAGKKYELPIVTEVIDTRDVYLVSEYADMLQIGARNTQNFALLKEVGKAKKPVMLKRGMNSTLEEWLNSAEYILNEGNENVLLCERGVRTVETYTRNTLDLSIVSAVKNLSHLPIITDPSHGTGRRELIAPMSLCSVIAGADGIMVEVHPNPKEALSDGKQALLPIEFGNIMLDIKDLLNYMGR